MSDKRKILARVLRHVARLPGGPIRFQKRTYGKGRRT
jgi:hypothetical protein